MQLLRLLTIAILLTLSCSSNRTDDSACSENTYWPFMIVCEEVDAETEKITKYLIHQTDLSKLEKETLTSLLETIKSPSFSYTTTIDGTIFLSRCSGGIAFMTNLNRRFFQIMGFTKMQVWHYDYEDRFESWSDIKRRSATK